MSNTYSEPQEVSHLWSGNNTLLRPQAHSNVTEIISNVTEIISEQLKHQPRKRISKVENVLNRAFQHQLEGNQM